MRRRKKEFACADFRSRGLLDRRTLLKVGGMGALGLTMPKLLQAAHSAKRRPRARAKSVIFLFQWGGPSHVDMFDMKPEADQEHRSPHKQIRTSSPEIEITEHLTERQAARRFSCQVAGN